MDPAAPRPIDPDAKPGKPSPPLPNGTVKKRPPPSPQDSLYRECMKNHAASLGGHALDGCGEFMPSPSSNPADPTSLKCAACGCHRNFHRRLPDTHLHLSVDTDDDDDVEEENNDKQNDDGDDDDHNDKERRQQHQHQQQQQRQQQSSSSPPPHYFSSAPHMLLALSTGVGGGGSPAPALQRKRFRTKFSTEQKGRMQELSERLGWRMQKRDEGVVEEWCKGIGVGKGVFKVWMHNNKHNFVPGSSRRGDQIGGAPGGSGLVGGGFDGSSSGGGGGGGDVGGGGDNGHAVNGSSSSS